MVNAGGCDRGSEWEVHKFGGTCVATAERIEDIVQFLHTECTAQKKVAVVSAMGSHPTSPTKVTDLLLNMISKASKKDKSFDEDLDALKEKHEKAATALLGKGAELDAFLQGLDTDMNELRAMLKTFSITQLDVLRKDVVQKMKKGNYAESREGGAIAVLLSSPLLCSDIPF